MLKEKLFFILLIAVVVNAIPRPGDSDESKDDDDDDDVCNQPAQKGPKICRAAIHRWTFNAKKGACQPYLYGGCGGTGNLFDTEEACNAKCINPASVRGAISARTADAAPSPCTLPLAAGNCRAYILNYYFDAATGTCKQFAYTGCKGNANNFATIEDCQKTCRSDSAAKMAAVTLPAPIKATAREASNSNAEICNLPPIENTGRVCLAFIPSWTFNSKSGKCESYIYGGCGKTANLFKTEGECEATCGPTTKAAVVTEGRDVCLLPTDKGPCFGFAKRYAFNKEKNRCEMFTYGGCQGNANNFATADQCFETCGGALPSLTPECEQVICKMNKMYLERGCRPEYKGKACCPSSYTCPDAKSSGGVCRYGGAIYKIGQAVPAVSEDQPCKSECFCVSSAEHQDGATIKCSETTCPAVAKPDKEGCELVTKPNTCCPTYDCHDSSEEKEVDICLFDGKEYKKGQSIPTGDPCNVCTCVEGFKGLNGPGCRKANCLVDNRIGCVPVYTENVCCPTSYKCPKTASLTNQPPFLQVEGEPGKQGVMTLPSLIPGGSIKKWQVKAAFCLKPKDTGPCRMSLPSFYYDSDQMKCLPFYYGGCKGNENRFETEEQCYAACQVADEEPKAPMQGPVQPAEEQPKKSPFITVGAATTLPALISPAAGEEPKKTPFISSGAAVTLPALISPAEKPAEEQPNKSPFITSGAAVTLPALISPAEKPAEEQPKKSPFITSGAAVTLPALVGPADRPKERVRSRRCSEPMSTGPCRMSLEKFYFDTEKQDCLLFFYGGCKGNSNQFDTIDECRQTCTMPSDSTKKLIPQIEAIELDVCELPQEVGPCRAQVPAYYYNAETKACEFFWYSGCRGNGNRFETEAQCQSRCVPATAPVVAEQVATTTELPTDSIPSHCKEPAARGPCRASKDRFHYNVTAGECQPFRYGGCRGNRNNFETIELCQNECSAGVTERPPLSSAHNTVRLGLKEDRHTRCKLPADVGFCRAFQERFYYDAADHQCKTFSWGGCLGNANNFATPEECMEACDKTGTALVGRARARGFPLDGSTDENEHFHAKKVAEPTCTFGNETFNLGDRLASLDPCEECECSTPPELTCTRHTCPPPPSMDSVVCRENFIPGQCCPDYMCVSANPPFIDVCADVTCQPGERCEPQTPESADGSWMAPVGVCVADSQ